MNKTLDSIWILLGALVGVIFAMIFAVCNIETDPIKYNVVAEIERIPIETEEIPLVEISVIPEFVEEELEEEELEKQINEKKPQSIILTSSAGRVQGPTNEETWYNLPMDKVILTMRSMGYSEQDYPFYIREDGVKMLGDFVIVAANYDLHPRGSIVETSVGQGMVCDTGEFIFSESNNDIYDIAVDW